MAELKYIWVLKYNGILKNLGVNFPNRDNHYFDYKDGTLDVTEKSGGYNPIPFGDNINSVTTIAGQNGSGKSSLCEIIIEALATSFGEGGFTWNMKFVGIIVFGKHILYHKSININLVKNNISDLYKILAFEETPSDAEVDDSIVLEIKRTKFFYYSNMLDTYWKSRSGHPLSETLHHF